MLSNSFSYQDVRTYEHCALYNYAIGDINTGTTAGFTNDIHIDPKHTEDPATLAKNLRSWLDPTKLKKIYIWIAYL